MKAALKRLFYELLQTQLVNELKGWPRQALLGIRTASKIRLLSLIVQEHRVLSIKLI